MRLQDKPAPLAASPRCLPRADTDTAANASSRHFARQQLERRFVLFNLPLKRLRLDLHSSPDVRICVISERLCRRPHLQSLRRIGISFEFLRINESIGRRDMQLFQDREGIRAISTRVTPGGSSPFERQIIKRDRDLLRANRRSQSGQARQRIVNFIIEKVQDEFLDENADPGAPLPARCLREKWGFLSILCNLLHPQRSLH